MNTVLLSRAAVVLAAVSALSPLPARADEGMWLFTNPPRALLKSRYQFEPSREWLEHLQKSSVRFNSGGSGSFVSPDGLVMTNHHVASDCLQKLSTPQRDLLKTGFRAASPGEELKCVDLELNVLMSIDDVTNAVNAAVQPQMSAAEAQKARRAAINGIEKESFDKTGLRSDVVTLYQGGQYHLYRYKKYTDVRLVWAPEKAAAFFGGDPDNFEYPRYNLDVTFFRAYENGAPAKVRDYLKWSGAGAREGELVFVSGHPGRTDRLNTVRHLEFLRDVVNPMSLNTIRRREVLLGAYSARSLENARRAEDELFGYQNSRKARMGMLAGLQDPAVMAAKRTEEESLRNAVRKSPALTEKYGGAWDEVARAVEQYRAMYRGVYLIERSATFNSVLYRKARDLVRLAAEKRKPNAERLPEYAEAGLESLFQELYSEAPVYDDLEIVMLADSLSMMAELMGMEHPFVQQVLAGRSPQARAADLVRGTKLKDISERKRLAGGGLAAIEASSDAMIQFARLVDPEARRIRAAYEEKVDEPLRRAYAKIAGARFAVYGTEVYPDATFTLRLAFGQAIGYTSGGQRIPWATQMGGIYARAADQNYREPFNLPKSWLDARSRLNPATPFNFVSTADIIGGNSGSPVVNREGEVVGLIFDGNIQSLVLDYVYTDEQARAVAVHSAAILEALRQIYGNEALARELTGGGR